MSNLVYDILNLDDGELYEFVVYAANESGLSLDSNTVQARVIPGVPTGLDVTSSVLSMSYYFNAMTGATSYIIYYGKTSSAIDASLTTVNISGVISNLEAGQLYYFKVSAKNSSGESDACTAVSEYVTPAIPTGVQAVGDVNKITLSYSDVSCNGYNVYYKVAGGSFQKHNIGLITQTTYEVPNLLAGTQYYFYVKSARLSVEDGSEIESAASATVNAFTKSDVPEITDLTAGVNKITVAFTEETGAVSYKVYYGLTSGALDLSKGAVVGSPVDITGLTSGKLYYFQVTVINSAGESARSNEVSEYVIPAIPQNVALVGGVEKVTVSFDAVADTHGYNVYYKAEGGSFQKYNMGTITESSYDLTGLTSGERYYVKVTSVVYSNLYETEIESAYSSTVDAYVIPAVTVVTSTSALTTSIDVAFDEKYGATSYKVYYGTSSGSYGYTKSGVTSSPTTLNGLSAGTTYYIAVTTLNAAGESSESMEVSQITRAEPPTSLVAVGKVGAIDISYVAVTGAEYYTVYYGLSGSGFSDQITYVYGTTAEITGLLAGYYYNIKVSSTNDAGESETYSTTVYATTIATSPSSIALTGQTTQIAVSIPAVAGTTQYKIYYGTVASAAYGSSRTFAATGADPEVFTISGLLDGTEYSVKVTTINGAGESSFSVPESTITIPGKPSLSSVVAGVEEVFVTINAQTGADYYTVYYGEEGSFSETQIFNTLTGYITGLVDGRNYNFKVTATNDSGESVYSDVVYERIIPDQPGASTISAVGHYDKVTVTVQRFEGAADYVIYYGLSGDFSSSKVVTDSGSGASVSIDISGLQAGKYYSFRYTTRKTDADSEVESALSDAIAYARIAPAVPTFVQAVGGVRKATVSFTPVEGATRYVVKYRKVGEQNYSEYTVYM